VTFSRTGLDETALTYSKVNAEETANYLVDRRFEQNLYHSYTRLALGTCRVGPAVQLAGYFPAYTRAMLVAYPSTLVVAGAKASAWLFPSAEEI